MYQKLHLEPNVIGESREVGCCNFVCGSVKIKTYESWGK
jgi:hypothetical protein